MIMILKKETVRYINTGITIDFDAKTEFLQSILSILDFRIIKKYVKQLGYEDLLIKAENRTLKKERKTPPKKSDIIKYWFEEADEEQKDLLCIPDAGEPSCMICGMWWSDTYDIKDPNATMEDCFKTWDKPPLQKCHIVPRTLGGSNINPKNYLLLCHDCHDDMPDCLYSDILFKWIPKYQKIARKKRNEKFKEILDIYELELKEFYSIFSSEEFRKWEKENHVIGFHGFRIKESSLIGAVWKFKNLNLPYKPDSRIEIIFP